MKKTLGLGRGLDALIDTTHVSTAGSSSISEIPLQYIYANPDQPRHDFDQEALEELAQSIKEHGVISPITLRKNSANNYMIIAGERRYRASKMVGLETIPAYVRTAKDEQVMEWALIENVQREDLNAIEEALAYTKIMESRDLTHTELAKVVGKSQAYVTNTIGLLRLPEEVKDLVIDNKISMSHARALSKMSDRNTIITLANRVLNEGLSVRELEEISQGNDISKRVKVERKIKDSDREYKYIEEVLCEKLDTKVRVYKNKLEIKFSNINDLNRILELLNVGK